MRSKTIKYQMIFAGIAAVMIPLFIAGTVIYFQLSASLLKTAEENSVHIAEDISELIEAMLTQEIKLASAIAADPDIKSAVKANDFQVVQDHLEAIHDRIGRALFTIFITDKNGIVIADALFKQQLGLDLSDREYLVRGKEGKTSIVGPLLPRGTATPGQATLIVSAPIQKNKEFFGVVVMAFSADFLKELLGRKNMGRTGYAYLTNSQGLVLVHPRSELNLKLNLLEQPGTEVIGEAIRGRKTGTAAYSFEGVKKVAGLATVAPTGWIAVFTQDKSEIMAPVNRTLTFILLSGIAFILVTVLIIIFVYSRIGSPIQNMIEVRNQLVRHSTEIMLQLGLDRKISFANSAFTKITGIEGREILGAGLEFQQFHNITPDDLWDSLEKGDTWSGRVELENAKGDPVILDVMLMPVKGERGAIQGYLELGRDVTAEMMYEKRMRQAQKLEAIGTLAGGIAHDFNNILSGILGYAELSLMKKDSAEDTEKYLGQIIAASERARELISQILTFSRKTEVDLRPLSPKPVVKEALKLLRASIPATIDIQTDIDCDSTILGQATQLHQVVMNLFTNAVHAIGEKAGTIRLELKDYQVDEEFTKTHPNIKEGQHVFIRISDTGKGMEPELIENIFNPFFTTKGQGEGTGLGLSVVHGIINKMGGIITVYSEIGKGTVFNVLIPVVEALEKPPETGTSDLVGGSERVALVDDEPNIALIMESILSNMGYRVRSFSDSREALPAIMDNPNDFDLIITDYSMPGLTGLELVERLRDKGVGIPVILTTGYLDDRVREAAKKVGVSELIFKPINTRQLTEAIHQVVGHSISPDSGPQSGSE